MHVNHLTLQVLLYSASTSHTTTPIHESEIRPYSTSNITRNLELVDKFSIGEPINVSLIVYR